MVIFYKDLILLLEMKNDKNHDYKAFKELSTKLIHSDKGIAQQAALNSVAHSENKKNKNNFAEIIANDINNIDIHNQFEFFKLLGFTYSKPNLGFRYCEYPQYLDEFIKRNYLISVEKNKLEDFRKMDKGRKSIYFYKLAPEILEIRQRLYKTLSVKFPKVQSKADEEGLFFTEKRIIDTDLIKKDSNQNKVKKVMKYIKMFIAIPPFIEDFIIKFFNKRG